MQHHVDPVDPVKIPCFLKWIQNPGITKEEIAGHLNITLDGVKYHIKKLTKAGIISWKGPSKGGHWEIQPDEPNRKSNLSEV